MSLRISMYVIASSKEMGKRYSCLAVCILQVYFSTQIIKFLSSKDLLLWQIAPFQDSLSLSLLIKNR
jgi:hypothetical protein